MIIGNILLSLALASALAACYYYFLAARGQQSVLKYARWLTVALLGFVAAAGLYLLALVLTNQFQVGYVWENSSTTLPLFYKISAFWGGQEGSIMLWLLWGVVFGMLMSVVFRRDKNDSYEPHTMFVMSAIQLFPLALLMLKSPFRVTPDVPFEGNGLNPLLQDPYMVIHPPILFLGFAGLSTAYAFAVAAFWKRDYSGWIRRAWPWVLAAWGFLGLGLSIGGFWAYRVLGWGGYWGWDPVENSSLVPWLLGGALVHGLITQKTRGRFVRWNLFLALAVYVLVIYSTFLTRSGVLADFSVHTFGESPLMPVMLGGVLAFAGVGLGLFIYRYRDIPPGPDVFKTLLSRDFTSLITVIAFIFGAAAVAIGTSSPIITGIIAGNGLLCGGSGVLTSLGAMGARLCQQSNVATSYYSTTSIPLGFVMAFLMMLAPILAWQESNKSKVIAMLKWPFVFALACTILAAVLLMREPLSLAIFFLAMWALGTNLLMIVRIYHANIWKIGGYLAHVGFALALVGIIGSTAYRQTQRMTISEGQTVPGLGYTFQFQGLEQVATDKWAMQVLVKRGEEAFIATPKLVPTDNGMVRNPYIKKYVTEDLYVSPGDYDPGSAAGTLLDIPKGETVTGEGYSFKFVEFTRSGHDTSAGTTATNTVTMGAILEVTKDGVMTVITPTLTIDPEKGTIQTPVALPGGTLQVVFDGADVDKKIVGLAITDKAKTAAVTPAFITLEVSREPGINALWGGLIIMAVGVAISVVRRRREAVRAVEAEPQAEIPLPEPAAKGKAKKRRTAAQPGAAQPSQASRLR